MPILSMTGYVFIAFMTMFIGIYFMAYNMINGYLYFFLYLKFHPDNTDDSGSYGNRMPVPLIIKANGTAYLAEDYAFILGLGGLFYYVSAAIMITCQSAGKRSAVSFSDIIQIDMMAYFQYQQIRETAFDGEGQITSAVNYVTNDTQTKVYTLTGHQESSLSSTAADSGAPCTSS